MTRRPTKQHLLHQTLFNAATIGNVDLANRVALAPMTRVSATADGLPTDRIASYYRTFAQGGFALLITEGLYIDDARAPGLCSCCPLKVAPAAPLVRLAPVCLTIPAGGLAARTSGVMAMTAGRIRRDSVREVASGSQPESPDLRLCLRRLPLSATKGVSPRRSMLPV